MSILKRSGASSFFEKLSVQDDSFVLPDKGRDHDAPAVVQHGSDRPLSRHQLAKDPD